MYENWKIKKSDLDETLAKEQEKVAEWCNENQQYRINDDETYIFVEPIPAPTEESSREQEIARLKAYLGSTDWVVVKCAEGAGNFSDYEAILNERAAARAKINELEAK